MNSFWFCDVLNPSEVNVLFTAANDYVVVDVRSKNDVLITRFCIRADDVAGVREVLDMQFAAELD